MTRREQKIETALREFLRAEGFSISQDGDVYAMTRDACLLAQAGEACPGATGRKINISDLAREVERAL